MWHLLQGLRVEGVWEHWAHWGVDEDEGSGLKEDEDGSAIVVRIFDVWGKLSS